MNKFTKVLAISIIFFGFLYMGFYIAKLQAPQRKAKEAIVTFLKRKSSPLDSQNIFVKINTDEQVSLPRLSLVRVTTKAGEEQGIHCAVIGPQGAVCEGDEGLIDFVVREYHLRETPHLLSDPDWLKLVSFLLHVQPVKTKSEIPLDLTVPKEISEKVTLPEIKRQLGGYMTLSFYFMTEKKEGRGKALGYCEVYFAPNQPLRVLNQILYSKS